jgi:pimeloyl-ACP methyl ester carboxylesterase
MKHPQLSVSSFIIVLGVMIAGCGQAGNTDKESLTKPNDTIQSLQEMQNRPVFKNGYLPVNGIKMYYEIHGSGQPLVLIHGGGSTITTSFGKILPLLAKNHKVIAVELQAHGHTSDRNEPESFEQDANDVAGLLSQLNINAADILGFSNGGHTAMQLAISHPEKIRKLIIASAFYKKAGTPAAFWEMMNHATFAGMPQPLKDAYLKINNDTAALLNMFHKDVHRMQNFKDWSDKDIKSITVPALLIAGDKDIITPEHAVAMSRLIPHCQLAILPGGHGNYLGEITTLINGKWTQEYASSLIEQFLDAPDR